jgi:ATP-dependent Clp protease ATP-binding subunit ClpC
VFERVSEPARHVLVLGQEEARRLGHGEIGTDHMLLGIIRLPDEAVIVRALEQSGDRAASALSAVGVSLDQAREAVVALRGPSPGPTQGQLPLSDETRDALSEGMKTALRLGSKTIEPTHFLLAMIAGPSAAAQTLDRLGVVRDELRERLKQ